MKAISTYSRANPLWIEADVFEKVDERHANIEAWGERFENCVLESEPSDRASAANYFVVVEHSSGNWLHIYHFK